MAPIRARVRSWSAIDQVGTLELEDGRTLRFGGTACRGLRPAPGLDVFVTAIGPHPLGGERALSLRSEAITEEAAAARADAERDAARRSALAPVERLATEIGPMPVPDGYEPDVLEVQGLLLPRTRALLESIRAASLQWLGELLWEKPPWSFHDPCVRGFGADGAGNVYALHVYPPRAAALQAAPVVFWDHEQHVHRFLAGSFESFLAMLFHEALGHRDQPDRRTEAAELAERLSIEPMAPTAAWDRWDADPEEVWPLPPSSGGRISLPRPLLRERTLVRSLVECTFETPAGVDAATLRELDHRYAELGWDLHRRCLHYQVNDWLDHRRQWALFELKRAGGVD